MIDNEIKDTVVDKDNVCTHESAVDDLEELRSKYLHKGRSKGVKNIAKSDDPDDLNNLRNMYLHRKSSAEFAGGADKAQLIPNIILLVAVVLTTFCTFVWFAMPTMKLGGVTYNGKTQNIFSFLFFGEDSMIETIKVSIENVKNFGSNGLEAITSATRMVRLMVIGLYGVIIFLQTLYYTVMAVIRFIKRNSIGLRSVAVSNIGTKLSFYVILAFFGSLSGGSGESAYYHGYTAGVGMTVGLALATGCLIAVVVLTYLKRHGTVDTVEKEQFRRSVISCVGYSVIAVMLAFMNLFGVLMYALTSATQAVAYTVSYSFEIKVILFPILNLVIFSACTTIYKRTVTGFTGSFVYMMTFDSIALINKNKSKKSKKIRESFSLSFTIPTVLSAVALVATLLLGIPSIGFGWSFDFYPYLIVIMTVSAVGQILLGVLFKPVPHPPSLSEHSREIAQTV